MKHITITIPDEMDKYIMDKTLIDGIIDPLEQFKRDAFILQPYVYIGKLTFDDACKILKTSPEILSSVYKEYNLPIELEPRDKIYSITSLRRIAKNIFDKVGYVKKAYLYGSYAKGTATKRSNINIVVELNKYIGKEILNLDSEFEKATCKDTMVFSLEELAPEVLESIKKEFVPLYEFGMSDPIGW